MAEGTAAPANLDLYQTSNDDDVVLEGKLTSASFASNVGGDTSSEPGDPGFNTLDEPIKDTIMRDVRAVGKKFYHVLYPVEKKSLLKVRC